MAGRSDGAVEVAPIPFDDVLVGYQLLHGFEE
jgi:hypothetical protein